MAHVHGTDLDTLWDFADPAGSEQRLRQAAASAEGVIADELRTQVARALGLQARYPEALTMLDAITTGDAVVQQRVALERGRVHNSAGDLGAAIPLFREAYRIAADPFLTVDAIHMLAIADVVRAEEWFRQGLVLTQAATDPRVRRWEGSLRNNYGWHLADQGDLAGALMVFEEAEAWFRSHGTPDQLHIARWSVAHVLRRSGEVDRARAILLDLQATDAPDPYVDEELGLV